MPSNIGPLGGKLEATVIEMASNAAQLVADEAYLEKRQVHQGDYLRAAMAMTSSAYLLAELGGIEGLRGYAMLLRQHLKAVERIADCSDNL